ncbi:MAG TPA: dienelactone hydrolase family protein [Edaphobacter sp.]
MSLHQGQPVRQFGASLKEAEGAVVMLHGRGGSAEDILSLASAMYRPGLAYLAPQAAGHSWYPYSFLAPREENEPWLSSALLLVKSMVQMALDVGIAAEKIVLCGFSQGACLSSEFVVREPRRYGGLIGFTGGLIGATLDEAYPGDLGGMPVFLGSGDPDPHVPWARVEKTGEVLRGMGAEVTMRRYLGRQHTISGEEVDFGKRLVDGVFG